MQPFEALSLGLRTEDVEIAQAQQYGVTFLVRLEFFPFVAAGQGAFNWRFRILHRPTRKSKSALDDVLLAVIASLPSESLEIAFMGRRG